MSHAVLSSVSPWQVLYSAEGSLLDTEYPAVNESVAVVVDSAPCVARSIARAVATTELSNEHTTLDTITHISAVRQTFKVKDMVQFEPERYPHFLDLLCAEGCMLAILAVTSSQ